jgi:hypothetical protein
MVEKIVDTNIKQTVFGQALYFTASSLQHLPLQHLLFGDFAIVFSLFLQRHALSSSGCIN